MYLLLVFLMDIKSSLMCASAIVHTRNHTYSSELHFIRSSLRNVYLEASSLLSTWEVLSLALIYKGLLLLISTSCSRTFFSKRLSSRDHRAASCFLAFS